MDRPGLERGRFALISKTHHALVDGVAGVDIATVLFDLSPVPAEPADEDQWAPAPEPSDAELVVEGIKGLARTPIGLAGSAIDAAQHPGRTFGRVREAAEGVGEVVWAGMNPAPDVPLNVQIGPHRRIWWVQSRLSDFKEIKNALGGTVNDAVLTVVAGALGNWLTGARCTHRGPRAARTRAGLDPWAGRARHPGQPDRRDARAASRLRTRSGGAARASYAR